MVVTMCCCCCCCCSMLVVWKSTNTQIISVLKSLRRVQNKDKKTWIKHIEETTPEIIFTEKKTHQFYVLQLKLMPRFFVKCVWLQKIPKEREREVRRDRERCWICIFHIRTSELKRDIFKDFESTLISPQRHSTPTSWPGFSPISQGLQQTEKRRGACTERRSTERRSTERRSMGKEEERSVFQHLWGPKIQPERVRFEATNLTNVA